MCADMGEPHPLLELQRLDLHADALRTRRAGLPERAACAAREAELAALAAAWDEAEAREAALGREEERAEALVTELRVKAREVETRLYSGEVKAIKELETLQHELREWQRRQGEQEGAELALMEQQERLAGELADLDARRERLGAERDALRAAVAAAEGEIDSELARTLEARAAMVAQLEPAILKRYEALRAAPPIRGRAAVEVRDDTCTGCRATLPIAFAAGLTGEPAGTIVACPRCGRLLVL
jgi:predicted  nucleic acid-binding Zn-ribbon protein